MQVLMDDMADHLAQIVKQCGDFKDVVSASYFVCCMFSPTVHVCVSCTDQYPPSLSQLSDKELAYNLTVALERIAELSR